MAGAELYCLHRNRWWQTTDGPRLDAGALVAGLEYAAGIEATVLGKPSPEYFAAALEAIDADPELTWMVGDDLEGDIAGAQTAGMRTVLVRTGQVPARRPRAHERRARRDRLVDRAAAGLARGEPVSGADPGRGRPDRDRAGAPGARPARRRRFASAASPRPSAPTASRSRTRPSTTPAASRPRRRSARRSARASTSPGARSRSAGGRSRACI